MIIPGCPSAMSLPEVVLLQRLARTRKVVEAGALLGFSTIQLARVSPQRVTSIDLHQSYRGATERRYRSNLDRAGVSSRVEVIVDDVLRRLPGIPADLALIDLTAAFDLTLAAVLATPAPIVAIHDLDRNNCPAIEKVVKCLNWPVLDRADTLIALERR